MPEFRFRRRKQQKRRQTLLDAEESAAQIQAAKKQTQSEGASGEGVRNEKNSTAQDSEKFLKLLRGKHPSDGTRIELDHVLANGEEKEEEEEEVDQGQTSTVSWDQFMWLVDDVTASLVLGQYANTEGEGLGGVIT